MTPNIMFMFPRDGKLNYDFKMPDAWSPTMAFPGNTLRYELVDVYQESPFSFRTKINSRQIIGDKTKVYMEGQVNFLNRLTRELKAISSSTPKIEEIINSLNLAHNILCAPEIEWRKEIRDDIRKRKSLSVK